MNNIIFNLNASDDGELISFPEGSSRPPPYLLNYNAIERGREPPKALPLLGASPLSFQHSLRVVAAELTRLARLAIVIGHGARKPSRNIGEAEGAGSSKGRS